MTLTPAYGRDYKSKKEVQADWDAGKDFVIADLFSGPGTYINKQGAREAGLKQVFIRYKQNRSITTIKV